jgi:hypothetical protein
MALKYKNNQYLESGKKILYEHKCLVTASPFGKLAHVNSRNLKEELAIIQKSLKLVQDINLYLSLFCKNQDIDQLFFQFIMCR